MSSKAVISAVRLESWHTEGLWSAFWHEKEVKRSICNAKPKEKLWFNLIININFDLINWNVAFTAKKTVTSQYPVLNILFQAIKPKAEKSSTISVGMFMLVENKGNSCHAVLPWLEWCYPGKTAADELILRFLHAALSNT